MKRSLTHSQKLINVKCRMSSVEAAFEERTLEFVGSGRGVELQSGLMGEGREGGERHG